MPVFTISEEDYKKTMSEISDLDAKIRAHLDTILDASAKIEHLREARRRKAELIEKFWREHGDTERSKYP